jgi:hypothetical protein
MHRLMTSRRTSTLDRQTPLSRATLAAQNSDYRDSGGVSAGNGGRGFRPAFLDQVTGIVYRSCFANGCAAPVHVLEGLPDGLVVKRDRQGRVMAVREGIIAGFLQNGVFYTRDQAARALSH